MSEHQKIFTFSFELQHILYVKNSKIVKSKDVVFDNTVIPNLPLGKVFSTTKLHISSLEHGSGFTLHSRL